MGWGGNEACGWSNQHTHQPLSSSPRALVRVLPIDLRDFHVQSGPGFVVPGIRWPTAAMNRGRCFPEMPEPASERRLPPQDPGADHYQHSAWRRVLLTPRVIASCTDHPASVQERKLHRTKPQPDLSSGRSHSDRARRSEEVHREASPQLGHRIDPEGQLQPTWRKLRFRRRGLDLHLAPRHVSPTGHGYAHGENAHSSWQGKEGALPKQLPRYRKGLHPDRRREPPHAGCPSPQQPRQDGLRGVQPHREADHPPVARSWAPTPAPGTSAAPGGHARAARTPTSTHPGHPGGRPRRTAPRGGR